MPTVAAINGHAYAGGWLLAIAHDYRIMNSEKGYVCMTEIDIGARLTEPMDAFYKAKLPLKVASKMLLEGCRLNSQQALEMEMLDDTVPADQVLEAAIQKGQSIAPKAAGGIYGKIKEDLYCDAVEVLRNGPTLRSEL